MLLKKISAKTLVGDVKKLIAGHATGTKLDLFTIMGVSSGVESGSSTYGDWVAFKGKFEATNLETGEVSLAPKCFLPEPLQSMTVEALREHGTVEFAIVVGVLVNTELPMGYEYTCNPLHEIKQSDDLAHLRALTTAYAPKLLAAPAPAETITETVAEKPAKKK